MLRKISLPLQLVIVIGAVLLFGHHFNEQAIRFFYTVSLFFKEMLAFLLPFIVFSFVLSGILSFKKNAPIILSLLLLTIFLSNMLVALFAYGVAQYVLPFVTSGMQVQHLSGGNAVLPFYHPELPHFLSSEKALMLAVILGIAFSFKPFPRFEQGIRWSKGIIEKILIYGFIPFIPLYVLGFLLKIHYEGVFVNLIQHYGKTFVLIVLLQLVYLVWLYAVAAGFSWHNFLQSIRNAFPSYLTAFGTMSSTATIPVSVQSAEKNTGHRPLAEMSMPIMANVHLLGDSISTPILALVTISLFLGVSVTFMQYMRFVFYFCITMFAVSGIPGGGIIVMIPLLISIFGFTSEMVSIITTLYLLFDPFGTAANVMGDGALVIIVKKLLRRLRII